MLQTTIKNFTQNPKNDILSGLTVALALVPEAVAFAFVAGIDPLVGLYGAFMMGIVTALFGGTPWDDKRRYRCHGSSNGSFGKKRE